ncbi:MAG: class A beta-lactamase-related serine hydrolase [Lactobacillaceae bacterium]|nr:class A beta-lactamase-related serine hydrolase [Lactobacillaceae bacterium]
MRSRTDKNLTSKTKRYGLLVLILIATIGLGFYGTTKSNFRMQDVTNFVTNLTKEIQHPKAVLEEEPDLKKAWQEALGDQTTPVSIAVYDNKTGITTTYTNDENNNYYMASTVKVSILAGLLDEKHKTGENLSDNEDELATLMIEDSDNDAATSLLDLAGGVDEQTNLYSSLGMDQTSMPAVTWGYTKTIAADQLKLLNEIFYDGDFLPSASRSYISGLMDQVDSSQAWGITAGTSDTTNVQLKNGWLENEDGWIVNSIGHVQNEQVDYTIAIYTDKNESEDSGIENVEKLAKATIDYMSTN